jgi:hypothetical protein
VCVCVCVCVWWVGVGVGGMGGGAQNALLVEVGEHRGHPIRRTSHPLLCEGVDLKRGSVRLVVEDCWVGIGKVEHHNAVPVVSVR